MKKLLVLLCITMLLASAPGTAADMPDASKAAGKFSRGATNVATCWGEYFTQLPKAVESSPDYLTAIVYGALRGTAFTVRRAAVGLYDMATSPFPGKNNYAPVIQPETVFTKAVEPLMSS